ncbi:MAG: helix-turn-helix domain-containing protein [Thermodesulfovibrionia bacterium]|nr:helix-turn-helix domain-containing protein [Thermodesulfovibrionia bacterium]
MQEEKKMRVAHVARRLDVSDKTIYRWIDEGIVFNADKIKRLNGNIRILESEVNRVLNSEGEAQ